MDVSDQNLQGIQFPPGTNTNPSNDEVAVRIHEAVVSHYHNILRDFESIDYAKIGSVSAEDFREVLVRHVMRMNDEQVRFEQDMS